MYLKPGREKSVLGGHPWVFSGAVSRVEGDKSAPLARVVDSRGRALGFGFFSPGSQIPVRMLGGPADDEAAIEQLTRRPADFFRHRLESALALRSAVVPPETTGYRLVNAEGDRMPGWVVDRFGDVLVSQITARGLEALRDHAYAALFELVPGCQVIQKNDLAARRRENLPRRDEVISGPVPEKAAFTEHGLHLLAEIDGGQKTGFYLDQRENRLRAGELATGRQVLDLFAHSGATVLHALRGGAEKVVAVESAPRLAELAREQLAANDLPAERLQWVEANVFEDLRERREKYGLVICDPPPLVPRKRDVQRGSRAYKDLNRLALKRVAPGGFFLTFTCSSAIDAKLFRQILYAAAQEAGTHLQLLAPLGAAPDHPFAVEHPEGEYLRGWLGAVPA